MKQVMILMAMFISVSLLGQEHSWEKVQPTEETYQYETVGTLINDGDNSVPVKVIVEVSEGSLWLELYDNGNTPNNFLSDMALLTVRRENGAMEHYSLQVVGDTRIAAGKQDKFYNLMTQGTEEELQVVCRVDDATSNYKFTLKTK